MSESAASRALLTASPYPFGGVSVAVTGGRRRRHSRKHRGGAAMEPAPVEVKVGGAEMLEEEEEIEGGRRHKRRHSRRHTKKGGKRHYKKRHTRKH